VLTLPLARPMGKADKPKAKAGVLHAALLKSIAEAHQQSLALFPPPIPFYVDEKEEKKKKDKNKSEEKDNFKEISLRLDPEDENGETLKKKVRLFENGTPEEWFRWRIEFDEVVRDAPLLTPQAQNCAAVAFLRGKAKDYFQAANLRRTAENLARPEDDRLRTDDIFAQVIEDVGKRFFPTNHAYIRQVNYMRHHLYMVKGTTLHEFKDRLLLLNSYLSYFPTDPQVGPPRSFLEWELRDILDRAKTVGWHLQMLGANLAI